MNGLDGTSNAGSRADPRESSPRVFQYSDRMGRASTYRTSIGTGIDVRSSVEADAVSPAVPGRASRRWPPYARSGRTGRPAIGAGERRVVRAETESTIDVARAEVGPSSRARACAVRPGELPRTDRTGAVGISVPVLEGLRRWPTRERGLTGPSRGDTLEPRGSRVPRCGATLWFGPATVPLGV